MWSCVRKGFPGQGKCLNTGPRCLRNGRSWVGLEAGTGWRDVLRGRVGRPSGVSETGCVASGKLFHVSQPQFISVMGIR